MDKKTILFKGVNQISIDDKGRMAIPAKYRPTLMETASGQLVLTLDPDYCLLIYPEPIWRQIEPQLTALPALNKQARIVQRIFLGHASECEMDSQGRLLLPPPLRGAANIEKRATLVGQGWKFELWDSKAWNAQRKQWMRKAGKEQEVTEVLESIRL